MCQGCTCEGPACLNYLYTVTGECFIWLQHKAVAQAVWKPEKYKETSHTTCCHYDNQAESFSLISCHSTQHRNPIAFKSYATRPPIYSERLSTHLQIRFIGEDMLFYFGGCFSWTERVWGSRWSSYNYMIRSICLYFGPPFQPIPKKTHACGFAAMEVNLMSHFSFTIIGYCLTATIPHSAISK